jgi:hypothetical protein
MRPPRLPASRRDTAGAPSWVSRYGWQRRELVIWGAHGGAGTSTLAAWLQPAWDMSPMGPEPDPPYPAAVAHGRPLLVACRNTAWSAQQATAAVAAVARQGGHVAVVAVVSDGWPEPAAAMARFRLLEAHAGAVIRVPFVPGLRLADNPSAMPLPRRVRRALDQIRAVTGRTSPDL